MDDTRRPKHPRREDDAPIMMAKCKKTDEEERGKQLCQQDRTGDDAISWEEQSEDGTFQDFFAVDLQSSVVLQGSGSEPQRGERACYRQPDPLPQRAAMQLAEAMRGLVRQKEEFRAKLSREPCLQRQMPLRFDVHLRFIYKGQPGMQLLEHGDAEKTSCHACGRESRLRLLQATDTEGYPHRKCSLSTLCYACVDKLSTEDEDDENLPSDHATAWVFSDDPDFSRRVYSYMQVLRLHGHDVLPTEPRGKHSQLRPEGGHAVLLLRAPRPQLLLEEVGRLRRTWAKLRKGELREVARTISKRHLTENELLEAALTQDGERRSLRKAKTGPCQSGPGLVGLMLRGKVHPRTAAEMVAE